MASRFENDMEAFTKQVKSLKNLARGNAPSKSPGCYSSHEIVNGRDGNMWRNFRVYHTDTLGGYCDERYELVWIRATSS